MPLVTEFHGAAEFEHPEALNPDKTHTSWTRALDGSDEMVPADRSEDQNLMVQLGGREREQ